MNTDKVIKVLPGVVALGGMTYLASTDLPARYILGAVLAVSYGAVIALLALTAADYHVGGKGSSSR
ncbi:MAG: hypothetical protein PHQ04_06540 [Opitutaceae bacterium]|nr:hypothetical protein [Opitutaceae bacterium]